MLKPSIFSLLVTAFLLSMGWPQAQAQVIKTTLNTEWTNKVNPENVHPEYPRPQMKRTEWQNLNGLWDYQITSSLEKNTPFDGTGKGEGQILVPFPIESALSGVQKPLLPDQKLWYNRTFDIPKSWKGQRVILHFGAVDWETQVWVNGQQVGAHQGGYNPFSFDITKALSPSGTQKLTISVWDPTDDGFQPTGKQSLNPQSIWYTATSGIWQTVWLEPVPDVSIESLKLIPDIDEKTLKIKTIGRELGQGYTIRATAFEEGKTIGSATGDLNDELHLALKEMKLWSPNDPFLYDLTVTLFKGKKKIDEVQSYFGMRKISIEKDQDGFNRLFLNNQPLFQLGPLDQGFWPDGLYTAPTDEALKFDIQKTKDWGFNMIRKHVKVEPERWYYHCDKIGLLVWQDMPNGDKHIGPNDPDIDRTAQSAQDYKKELKELIETHFNHPSIVTWVPFNEGWGQFQTAEIAQMVKTLDPDRLVNATTGWADRGVGDMIDKHQYPGPSMFPVEENRASVLGEFGGQALVVKDHLWLDDFSKAPNHYKTSTSASALHDKYEELLKELKVLKKKGLAAAVYTQTTDLETEVNGLMTYDRKVIKFDENQLKKWNEAAIKE